MAGRGSTNAVPCSPSFTPNRRSSGSAGSTSASRPYMPAGVPGKPIPASLRTTLRLPSQPTR
ncbi:hypothetical protein [Nonomuraea lactucae]|uniref:hypothetical protein n=1 Tax=Nonomuraea lactucae TaxID=2249762 RepID=UPI003B83A39D